MAIDEKLVFFDAQAITNDSKVSSMLDFDSITQPGAGNPIYLNIYVDTAFTGATTGNTSNLEINLVSSSAAGCSNDVVVPLFPAGTDMNSEGILSAAGLIYRGALPATGLDTYVGLALNLSGAIASGKITAYLDVG